MVDPVKVDDVLQLETLKSVTEIRSFLRLAGYYHRFIRRFFEVGNTFDSVDSKGLSVCLGCFL